jgi:hypothetical protein
MLLQCKASISSIDQRKFNVELAIVDREELKDI